MRISLNISLVVLVFSVGLIKEIIAQNNPVVYMLPDSINSARDSLLKANGNYGIVFNEELINRYDPPRLDGKKYGKWVYFRRNGYVKKVGYWYSGNRVGTWIIYDRNNNEYKHLVYECGKIVKDENLTTDKIKVRELKPKNKSSVEKAFGSVNGCYVPDHVFNPFKVIIVPPKRKPMEKTSNVSDW